VEVLPAGNANPQIRLSGIAHAPFDGNRRPLDFESVPRDSAAADPGGWQFEPIYRVAAT